jgi:isoleucyl-tRNA synthetase
MVPMRLGELYVYFQQFDTKACYRIFLVNSPIVRAENLRFREDGVKEVIARVLLPWVNSFRFFLGQVTLLDRDTGIKFQYNEHAAISSNVMDRWVLARCQSLIKLVREEMAGESNTYLHYCRLT